MKTEKQPLLILTGPTAVGKTDLSIALAKRINGAVISADSMHMMQFIPTRPVRKLLHMSFIPVGLLT